MNRTRLSFAGIAVVIAAVIAIVVGTSGGSAKTSQTGVSSGPAISLKQTSLGATLVDGSGRTLYLFEGDKRDKSTLSAAGQAVWPPFTSAKRPQARGGASTTDIGTIAGTGQITYAGHPLYYYIGDRNPGQTAGQGLNQFGALWYVLGGTGSAITSASSSSSGTSSGSSSIYGY
jgi:predicted lipoprotein with Yx(FWY)xxD motif